MERESELAALERAVDLAEQGAGRVVLISGEAGMGKTSVVGELTRRVRERSRVLIGSCDDLIAPRPLGPFHDMALGPASPVRQALQESPDRDAVLSAMLTELSSPLEPTVVVIEDAHWADEATQDVLRFLARRIPSMRTVLVVTYRDQLPAGHPLLATLGALVGPHVDRLPLSGFSEATVAALVGDVGLSAPDVNMLTGGVPFLVMEVLAAPDSHLPRTVKDAVTGRLQALTDAARASVELLAVVPGGVTLSLLDAVAPDAAAHLPEAERHALVEVRASRIRFRHELLRRAVEATCTATQLAVAHARFLAALCDRDAEAALLVHHAVGAGDAEAVAAYAPLAALEAARVGSHREAAALYERALENPALLIRRDEAELRWRFAYELYLANRHVDAAEQAQRAVDLIDDTDEVHALGRALAMLSHTSCWAARPDTAADAAVRAVEVLQKAAPSSAVVDAYANLSFVQAMQGGYAAAARSAEEGLALDAAVGGSRSRPYVLTQRGGALMLAGDEDGEALLREAIAEAQRRGTHQFVPLACTWLSMGLIGLGRPHEVGPVVDHGIAYSEEHEIRVGATTLRMLRHELQLRVGQWDAAAVGLEELVTDPEATSWGDTVSCTLLGRLRLRRGEDDLPLLDRGWQLALRSREPERIARAGAAWLERAHLLGDEQAREAGEQALAMIHETAYGWALGELLRLRAALDGLDAALDGLDARLEDVSEPWASGLRGDWKEAAAGWAALGWPYERARELESSDQLGPMLEALVIYDELGASVDARRVRRELRARGVRQLPRGPQRATRQHPAGLTERQAEVLDLLAGGLTNAEIAERLVLSVRTVDHHVSAILDKLGVASRSEAAARAAAFDRVEGSG
jgi:DNA-binding CsgD family transcriptional regulator/tetratricopeptide (TPR) repeat protein